MLKEGVRPKVHLNRVAMCQLDWLVVRDFVMIGSATFWKDGPDNVRSERRPWTYCGGTIAAASDTRTCACRDCIACSTGQHDPLTPHREYVDCMCLHGWRTTPAMTGLATPIVAVPAVLDRVRHGASSDSRPLPQLLGHPYRSLTLL